MGIKLFDLLLLIGLSAGWAVVSGMAVFIWQAGKLKKIRTQLQKALRDADSYIKMHAEKEKVLLEANKELERRQRVTYGLLDDLNDIRGSLMEKSRELNRSNVELQQFTYIASHDLREPLRMVISYLDLISERYQGKLDADADEFIRYAVDGAMRMQELISDLLDYSRLNTRDRAVVLADGNIVLAQVLKNLEVSIKGKQCADSK